MQNKKGTTTEFFKNFIQFLKNHIGESAICKILNQCGFSDNFLSRTGATINTTSLECFYKRIAIKANKDNLGLKFGAKTDITDLGLPGLLFKYSNDLKQAIEYHQRYMQLLWGFGKISISKESPNTFTIIFDELESSPIPTFLKEAIPLFYVKSIQNTSLNKILPLRVFLDIETTSSRQKSKFKALFNSTIDFNTGLTAIVYKHTDLGRPFMFYNPKLLHYLEHLVNEELTKQAKNASFKSAATTLLKRNIYNKNKILTLSELAKKLRVSPRTLQRKLKNENITYVETLEQVRKNIAIQKLKEETLNVNELSWFLGFSLSSSFITQFKRWTGFTPLAYKKVILKHKMLSNDASRQTLEENCITYLENQV